MSSYRITSDARGDMHEITRYTLDTWGREELVKNRKGLKDTFAKIGKGEAVEWSFAERFPGLLAAKYRRLFVFFSGKAGVPQ